MSDSSSHRPWLLCWHWEGILRKQTNTQRLKTADTFLQRISYFCQIIFFRFVYCGKISFDSVGGQDVTGNGWRWLNAELKLDQVRSWSISDQNFPFILKSTRIAHFILLWLSFQKDHIIILSKEYCSAEIWRIHFPIYASKFFNSQWLS